MDTATFLASVVAPGNYMAICFKTAGKPMVQRFFPRTNTQEAAGFIHWADGKAMDVWYAPASFKLAEAKPDQRGSIIFKGERTHANVDRLSCFWYDADIKRDGDGKDPSQCFASYGAVEGWVKTLPDILNAPNLWVRSGYGVHLYWVINRPLTRNEWEPRAQLLKTALIHHNAPGDVGITSDASRILRPPNTRNHKVQDQPVPVTIVRDTITQGARYGTD